MEIDYLIHFENASRICGCEQQPKYDTSERDNYCGKPTISI